MELLVFLISLFVLLCTGIPIAIVLMLCAIILLYWISMYDPMILAQQMVTGTDNYILTAIPFFILAGEIMHHGGISKRLIDFAEMIVGRFRGGLGYVTIVASILFAGLSGVAIADVSALGSVLIPLMVQAGYSSDRATGIVCASSLCAPIIPPSLPLIILGVTVELSIGKLFMAGVFPGLFLGFVLMATWFVVAKKDGYTHKKKIARDQILPTTLAAIPAMMMPVIIIVGIRMGIFTPTEGGAVAAVYAFIVARFVHKELRWKMLPEVLFNSVRSASAVMFIVATAYAIGWLITIAQVPQQITSLFHGLTAYPMLLMIALNILLLLIAMVMDLTPIILIFAPVIFPLIRAAGIDPYYFAIVMVLNLCIGLLTPPVGTVLYVGCSVSGLKLGQVVRGVLPFLLVEIGVLILFILFPQLIIYPMNLLH